MPKKRVKKNPLLAGVCLPLALVLIPDVALIRSAYSSQGSPAASSTPTGKHLLSQEIQLTGEETWVDTGIDVHAGEHVVVNGQYRLDVGSRVNAKMQQAVADGADKS